VKVYKQFNVTDLVCLFCMFLINVLTLQLILAQLISEPLWSSGQSSWLQIRRSRVRFHGITRGEKSRGSGTGSTQPREYSRRVNQVNGVICVAEK
jgi:hypothetical protein